MPKKLVKVMMIILFSLSVAGCWSQRELNELAIASAIGIDKADNKYLVSVQIVNPSEIAAGKGGGGYQTPVTVYTTTADTVFEAVRKMTTITSRKVFLAQLRVLVIGEAMAKEGITPILDYFERDREIREEDLYALIAQGGTAEDILKVLTHLEKIPATKLFRSLKTSDKYWTPVSANRLSDVIYDLMRKHTHPAISGVTVEGSPDEGDTKKNVDAAKSPAILKVTDTSVFREDKLIGWLNEQEGKGFNFITNRVNKGVEHFTCQKGGSTAVDIIRSKTKLSGHMKNGQPSIEVNVRMEVNLADVQCDIDLMNPRTLNQLEKDGEAQMKEIIGAALKKAQREYKSDIFGFGEVLHRSNPREWKKIEKRWKEIYPNVPVKTKVDIRIRNMGTISDSI